MKQTIIISAIIFILLFTNAYAYVDPCPDGQHNMNQIHRAYEDVVGYRQEAFGFHVLIYKVYHQCSNCGQLEFYYNGEKDERDSYAHNRYEKTSAGYNSTQHWDIGTSIGKSVCGKTSELATNVQYNTQNHTGLSSTWTDGGHVGTKHYYYNTCTKSECDGYRFLWRTINCPNPNHHVAPNNINPPVETE